MTDTEDTQEHYTIPESLAGQRLDQALASLMPDRSRSQIQGWIKAGKVRLGAAAGTLRPRDPVTAGDEVQVSVPPPELDRWEAQAIPLNVVYEDEAVLVIDKPAGLVVHPGAGNTDGTALNALLSHAPELAGLARAGIVHRLDKQTSGLMVVAKTEAVRLNLIEQLEARSVSRTYMTIVEGPLIAGGTVDAPVGPHAPDRGRMAVSSKGKPAITHYRVERKFPAHTLLRVNLETGRTHQIRVHMAHIHHPVVGDPVYGGRLRLPRACSEELAEALRGFKRQALHATHLEFDHPLSGERVGFDSPMAADMQALLRLLEEDRLGREA